MELGANNGNMEVFMAATKITITPECWQLHVERWRRSGLSQAEYCRRNDLNPNTFQWQKGREREREVHFVPVKLKERVPRLTIGIGDSIRVELHREFDVEELSRLIQALGVVK